MVLVELTLIDYLVFCKLEQELLCAGILKLYCGLGILASTLYGKYTATAKTLMLYTLAWTQ